MGKYGKTWLITGCSKGFGRALTEEILENAQDNVVATARDITTLSELVLKYPDRLLLQTLDVTNANEIQCAVSAALERFSAIDVLVNNAGYGLVGVVEEAEMSDIRAVFETNVFGLIAVTQAVLPDMRKNKAGHIFNFSSIAGLVGSASTGIYNATKFAVEGLSEALALEVQSFGIKVTIIEPGPFRTDFLGKSVKWAKSNSAYDDNEFVSQTKLRLEHGHKYNDQAGDPLKAVQLINKIARMEDPPLRIVLGNMAVDRARYKLEKHLKEIAKYEDLSRAMDYGVV